MRLRPEIYPMLVRSSRLPSTHRLILLTLDANARAGLPMPTTAQVAGWTGVGHRTIRVALMALRDGGLVAEIGRPPRWQLLPIEMRPRRVG